MRLIGSYFDLTDRFAPNPAPNKQGGDAGGSSAAGKRTRDNEVVVSVAKRLVPSAVRRNTVKRIVREAWRAAIREARRGGAPEAGDRAKKPVGACLVRLKRYPGAVLKPKAGRQARPQAAAAISRAEVVIVAAGGAVDAKPGLGLTKRLLRADADQLFAAFLRRRCRNSPAGSGPRSGPRSSLESSLENGLKSRLPPAAPEAR